MENHSRVKTPPVMFFLLDVIGLLIEAAVYFVSLILPVYFLKGHLSHPLFLLVLYVILTYFLAAVCFALTLVFIQRVLIPKVGPGRYMFGSPRTFPWLFSNRLTEILHRSPFKDIIYDTSLLRYLFLRGMGAKIRPTLVFGQNVHFGEPYMMTIGENVIIGRDANVSGHKIERDVLTVEPLEIGDNVLIGARAIVLPGVKIGANAVVGANSMVTRGTVIMPGETWAGNPAQKIGMTGAVKPADTL